MGSLLPNIDPDGLLEYSVVFTDRSLNHMSKTFQKVMTDISSILKKAYNAEATIVIPGGGTYGMEAIARQFATRKNCLVLRNGWFSYRWTQILDQGNIAEYTTIIKAKRSRDNQQEPFIPPDIKTVSETISNEKPDVVFAPHVETSSGILLPDDYLREIAIATHNAGGIFVLDCVASGALWVDMVDTGVDVLLTAPQKGWSSSPCSGLVMLSSRGKELIGKTKSTSYVCDLRKWLEIMEAYEAGGHAYHTTMPTDSLVRFRDTLVETQNYGFEKVREEQVNLGNEVRKVLEAKGFKSVAAKPFQSPSVVVSYTDNPDIKTGKLFAKHGVQIAAGVPLECDEGDSFMTFRIGLFGLDKLHNPKRSVANLKKALDEIESAN
ncbi:MAG: alanine--glyoxylate aminotransferase family protein [Pseudomonadota bacterium]|nr:alanine--glyoxylate aminotransferase family protein [Pseudomonadota bacterium]